MGHGSSKVDQVFDDIGNAFVTVGKAVFGHLPLISCAGAVSNGIIASKESGSNKKWDIASAAIDGASCLAGG